jgi:hypothetical protein
MKSLDVLEVVAGSIVTLLDSDLFAGFAAGICLVLFVQAMAVKFGW